MHGDGEAEQGAGVVCAVLLAEKEGEVYNVLGNEFFHRIHLHGIARCHSQRSLQQTFFLWEHSPLWVYLLVALQEGRSRLPEGQMLSH